jgi:hypothetical protein
MKFSAFPIPKTPAVPKPVKTPQLSSKLAGSMPVHLGGGKFWHPGAGVVANAQGVALHPDTAVERAKRGLPQMHPMDIGVSNP